MSPNTRLFVRLVAAVLLLAGLNGNRAAAADAEKDAQRPAREAQRTAQEVKTADQAAKLSAPAVEDVTYEQILANPDDLTLNYRYANVQVRRGDLKGAAATLERMLIIDPNRPDVRLLYAVVLYRLDNFVESERELDLLNELKLSGALGDEVKEYRGAVSKRRKKTHLTGRLAAGVQWDSNRNSAPSSGALLFLGTPLALSGNSKRTSDASGIFLASLDLRRAVGNHELFATANYYRAEQSLIKQLNLQAYSGQAGTVLNRGRNSLTLAGVFDHVLLAQSSYLRDYGASLRLEHKIGKGADIYLDIRDVSEDYVPTVLIPSANERDGIRFDATVGFDYALSPTMRWGAGYVHGEKHAVQFYNWYARNGIVVNHIWLLGRGMFLLTSGNWFYDKYRTADPFISSTTRQDDIRRVSFTQGAPLSLISQHLKDFLWTTSYEYYHGGSNVQNYAYFNHKVSGMLTYKFDMGF